jgi:hypothetical protein
MELNSVDFPEDPPPQMVAIKGKSGDSFVSNFLSMI